MKRFALVILAVVSLCLAPYLAVAHATGMAVHDMPVGHGGGPAHDMPGMAAAGCDHTGDRIGDRGDCAGNAAACAWVCAGVTAVGPGLAVLRAVPMPRLVRTRPAALLHKGMAPPLDERPPRHPLI